MNEKPKLLCSICHNPIEANPLSGWAGGNNAEPINGGRCCNDCDAMYVIPERIRRIYAQPQTKVKGN
jgi:hypothetical protein